MTELFITNLIGTWSPLAVIARNTVTGKAIEPKGPVQGCIMYTPDGYMSSIVQSVGLSNWSERWSNPTADESVSTIHSTQSYTGAFYVENTYPEFNGVRKDDLGNGKTLFRRTVYHDIQTSLYPNWRGLVQKRLATLELDDNGHWHLTMRLEEDVQMGNFGGPGSEGTWKLEVEFVRKPFVDPETPLPAGKELDLLI